MRAFTVITLLSILINAVLAFPQTREKEARYDQLIFSSAEQYQPQNFVDAAYHGKARIKAESDFDRFALSPVGAAGLCQFMPGTSAELRINPWVPEEAIPAMYRYVNSIYDYLYREHDRSAGIAERQMITDAAYNTGMGRVKRLCRTYGYRWEAIKWRVPLETRNYAPKIQHHKRIYSEEV